jgi:hypothetical protein
MRAVISTSILTLVALGTHATGVAGFAAPLARHTRGAPGACVPLGSGAATMPRVQARRRRVLGTNICKWLRVLKPAPCCARCVGQETARRGAKKRACAQRRYAALDAPHEVR